MGNKNVVAIYTYTKFSDTSLACLVKASHEKQIFHWFKLLRRAQ